MTQNDKTPARKPTDEKNDEPPAAGPHAKPELTADEKTPGAGA